MATMTARAIEGSAVGLGEGLARTRDWVRPIPPGGAQLVNDHVVSHARTASEDDAAAGRDRPRDRLRLSMPQSRALPEGFEALRGTIAPGALRGGIGRPATA